MIPFLLLQTTSVTQTQTEPVVTISFQPSQLLVWLIVGVIAGALAGILVRGRRMSVLGSLLVGLFGALVGGFIFTVLNIQPTGFLASGFTIRWFDIFVAFIGAVIVLILVGALFGWRRV